MSKMYQLRRYAGVGDPALPLLAGAAKLAGSLGLGKLIGGAGKLLGIGGAKASTALVASRSALPALVKGGGKLAVGGAAFGAGTSVAQQLLGAVPGALGAGGPRRRRGRGITAVELRGFNKVANLLRRVGMVPKATRRAPRRR